MPSESSQSTTRFDQLPPRRSRGWIWLLALLILAAGAATAWVVAVNRRAHEVWNRTELLLAAEPLAEDGIDPESWPAGVELVVEDATGRASDALPVCLASNRNVWSPKLTPLTRDAKGLWRIRLERGEPLLFKFTLGTWETVEVDRWGMTIANRRLPRVKRPAHDDEPAIVKQRIERFLQLGEIENAPQDFMGSPPAGATGNIRIVTVRGGGGRAKEITRPLYVWLPPGYDAPENAKRQYRVLLVMDGQNIFWPHDGIPVEHGFDETATRLIRQAKIEPIIIVGVSHSGAFRGDEYQRVVVFGEAQPAGAEFVSWLAGSVVPLIKDKFRVLDAPGAWGIAGTSIGGTIATEAAAAHPQLFGALLCESTPWEVMQERSAVPTSNWPARVFIGGGISEYGLITGLRPTDQLLQSRRESWIRSIAKSGGAGLVRVQLSIDGHHDERLWAQQLPDALEFLFPRGELDEAAPPARK